MSSTMCFYAIAGYDVTDYKTDKYDDWKWTDEGEKYICNQKKGNIQLFDAMDGMYLLLGYILEYYDSYSPDLTKIITKEVERQQQYVAHKLKELVDIGIISEDILKENPRYDIITFCEYR